MVDGAGDECGAGCTVVCAGTARELGAESKRQKAAKAAGPATTAAAATTTAAEPAETRTKARKSATAAGSTETAKRTAEYWRGCRFSCLCSCLGWLGGCCRGG